MNPSQVSLAFTFLCFIITSNVCSSDPTHLTDDTVSMNCGSTGTSSDYSGTKWLGDVQPRASPSLKLTGSSTTSAASSKSTSADPVPYKTARLSSSQFSYEFQVNPGQKIIRLHFNPSPYKGFKGLKDLFTVEAGLFTLLDNFSASLTANALRLNSLIKEFCLDIQENQLLQITFSAETSQSKDAYAFINGIEIISVPASFFYIQGVDIRLQSVGKNSLVNVDNSIAFEIIHRLNTKQGLISSAIFGIPQKEIGNSKNVSWKISVDVGFQYMVRLHFSKIGLKMAETGALKFKVFINEMNADTNSDIVVRERDGSSIPWYGDYMVMMNGRKQEGKRDLLICLQSDEEFMDGPLKGFEILKLSNHFYSLASPVPMPPSHDSTSSTIQILLKVLGKGNAIGTVAITIISVVSIIVHKLRGISEASSSEEVYKPSARAERICRRFSLSEMQLATRNFSDELLIGKGGFGKVYKGFIDKERNTVAVKRLKSNSKQGAREFSAEVETLSALRHINLVSLIGYCIERREMILVYEYMACGTLGDNLYGFARRGIDAPTSFLSWKQRLNICIGAARGIDYLHTGHRVIHRDVKASNILLDENFVAKVSDFGLAKAEDRGKLESHVSTQVKGTFGYLDPHYYLTCKLTRKSDTYGFGMVLLEALCGRRPVDFQVSEDERMLSSWARDKICKGEANQIVDSSLRDEISPNSLEVFMKVALKCLEDDPNNRPTMSQVVIQLEVAAAIEQRDSRNLTVSSYHIDEVARNVYPSNEDRAKISNESSEVQTVTFPPNKHTNTSYLYGKKDGRKPKTYSSSRSTAWGTFWRNRINPFNIISGGNKLPSELCRHFSFDDIKSATHKFSANHVISKGRFGRLYKGVIDGATSVAIKRLSSSSNQGVHDQFMNEIKMLSKLRHPHLVSLIGYCNEKGAMFLVYDYMARGSLRDHLYNSENSPLTWKQRLQICLGAAKGLHYLHTGVEQTIMHRDVKSRNILLNEKWEAKISEFSQSKVCSSGGDDTQETTFVQVLCARPPINSTLPLEQRNLAAWATFCHGEGTLGNIIDSNVKGQIAPECLSEFAGTAVACLRPQGIGRPSMRDVVLSLESTIKFQESAENELISP
ncbi:hypothetical protein ACS0TY_029142 [Phlomoides rotata]